VLWNRDVPQEYSAVLGYNYHILLLPTGVVLCTLREVCLLFALEQVQATRIFSGPGIQVSGFAPAYWFCSLSWL